MDDTSTIAEHEMMPTQLPALEEIVPSSIKRRRTHQSIVVARQTPLPPGFPIGPWPSTDEALVAIRDFTSGLATQGKGFGVVKNSMRLATTCAGAKVLLRCSRNANPQSSTGQKRVRIAAGTGCKWHAWLEEAEEGWVVKEVLPHEDGVDHNHELVGIGQQRAHHMMRKIPEHMIVFATMLKKAGQGPAQINKYVVSFTSFTPVGIG